MPCRNLSYSPVLPFRPALLVKACAASLALAACQLAAAQTSPASAADAAARVQQQEQERLREQQERLRRSGTPSGTDLSPFQPDTPRAEAGGPCHVVDRVELAGSTLLGDMRRDALVAGYAGRCLSARDIELLMGDVTRAYIDGGWVTSRAYLPAQDLRTRVLRLQVLEGRIDSLRVEGDATGRVILGAALAARAGDLLNIRDLEQAVDQINAMPGHRVKLDLLPGRTPGTTAVVFRDESSSPYRIGLAVNNQGEPTTGRTSLSAGIVAGGLLGLGEVLAFSGVSTLRPTDDDGSSTSATLGITLPNGPLTLGLQASRARFKTAITTPAGLRLALSGDSSLVNARLETLVYRNQTSRHSAVLSYGLNVNDTELNGVRLGVTSQRAETFSLGWTSAFYQGAGVFVVRPEATVGSVDLRDPPAGYVPGLDGLQRDFKRLTLDLNLERPFVAGGQEWVWSSNLRAQTSGSQLYASQKLPVGGPGSVRAYARAAVSGDSGYYWRNDLALLQTTEAAGQSLKLRWFAGVDIGEARNRDGVPGGGRLSGAALGVQAKAGRVSGELTLTHPLRHSQQPGTEAQRAWVGLAIEL